MSFRIAKSVIAAMFAATVLHAPASADSAPTPDAWERAQAKLHGAVVADDVGQPTGLPDSAVIGITPDHRGSVTIQRVKDLSAGAIRNGVTRNYADRDSELTPWFEAGVPVHPVISPRWECPRGKYDIDKNEMSEWCANWESWCRDIFTHYKGKIFYYILDNEPDLISDKAAVYTPAQAVEFTRIAYLTAKTIDPRIQIESPPTSAPETQYLRDMIKNGVGNYCDKIGIHIYGSQIDDNRFVRPWEWMSQYHVYKPISMSEAGVAVTWGRGPDGKRDPQLWRRNWQQLYYTQLKRFGVSQTILFSLYGTYDGDFSYVTPDTDMPVQPIFNEVKYGSRRRSFANGGFEQPNVFQREWTIVYPADKDAAPETASFVRGDNAGAHGGSGYVKLATGQNGDPVTIRRIAADLKPGYAYTLSGWVFAQGGATATLAAQGFDQTAGAKEVAATASTAGSWRKLSVRFVPTVSWAVVELRGQGGGSPESTVKWDDITLSAPSAPRKSAAPQDLSTLTTDCLVTLRWTPAADAAAYNIYRAASSKGPFKRVHTGVIGNPFTDWGVVNGQTYYYRVAPVNGGGEGAKSAPVAATPGPVTMAAAP